MNSIVTSKPERASFHAAEAAKHRQGGRELAAKANRISIVRLASFLVGCVLAFVGLSQGSLPFVGAALLVFAGFVAAVVVHARVEAKKRELDERAGVHDRHILRITGRFQELPNDGSGVLPPDHPYASDIDVVGPGSLFQRIDVTQTREGERALGQALGKALGREQILARQAAVEELAGREAFREDFEVLARLGQVRGHKLDHAPFMVLVQLPSLFKEKPWLKPVMYVLLSITAVVSLLALFDVVPGRVLFLPLLVQGALLWRLSGRVHHALDLITARLGFAQSYEGMLRRMESEPWQAPYLKTLRASLDVAGVSPSTYMTRLARYESFAQLRTQGPVYFVLNIFTMWDFFCLERIERFAADVGPHAEHWFEAVGELEMLCSLSTLRHGDPHAIFPEIDDKNPGFTADGLAHPLLPAHARITNDVALEGKGSLLVITGSNMAGKSTLLRAVGLNTALALAGGPVCARSLKLCPVRLRASMRIDDSLQRGASYFHAELGKLRMVVADLEQGPPVLFLLDELLRGTNARARNTGARSVLVHLLSRGALGLVATHDIGLSALESELTRVHNVHFTDVFEDGEMRFDYKLRPGPVTTSNALRLLAMAGIDVPTDDRVA
jgi:hypothetical protein